MEPPVRSDHTEWRQNGFAGNSPALDESLFEYPWLELPPVLHESATIWSDQEALGTMVAPATIQGNGPLNMT